MKSKSKDKDKEGKKANSSTKTSSKTKTKPKSKTKTKSKSKSKTKSKSKSKTKSNPSISKKKNKLKKKLLPISDLEAKSLAQLRKTAKTRRMNNYTELRKDELILKILEDQAKKGGDILAEGVLDIKRDGSHGVIRSFKLVPGENDVYVSSSQIKRFNLRKGDVVSGRARPPKNNEKYLSLLRIESVNGMDPEKAVSRDTFKKLTPVFPNEQIKLETKSEILSTRLIDILAPIGKGQRGMVVSSPKAGKTTLLKQIAQGISQTDKDIHLMVVLVGERPEEVTDMERNVEGEVVAANFDEPAENHTRIAEMALARAKRLVELGGDVVVLMDSMTRLARAYNLTAPPSGRTLSGGFDPVALYPPKRFFGAARNFEDGGSLTVVATALVDTGSRMDDLVYEEFKGTGNMELHLVRKLAEKRIYPAIDIQKSWTRNEELLLPSKVLAQSWRIRRMLETFKNHEKTAVLLDRMKKTKDNKEFLATLHEEL